MELYSRTFLYCPDHPSDIIPRTVYPSIKYGIRYKPVTLITGARQVSKTTIYGKVVREKGFNYVSLADGRERALAIQDPEIFLRIHHAPLIIDEAQYVPRLFDVIERIIDREKFEKGSNNGMYILTGSQMYNLMENVSQSMAGRVSIVDMSPLSMSEILERKEEPFRVDFERNILRSMERTISVDEVYGTIVRGCYPKLYEQPGMDTSKFYSDYVETYIERDVSQVINLKDKLMFRRFMEYIASITGQELVYDHIANALDQSEDRAVVDRSSSGRWIVHLLQPFVPRSNVKSITKRPELYFRDAGWACYLAGSSTRRP